VRLAAGVVLGLFAAARATYEALVDLIEEAIAAERRSHESFRARHRKNRPAPRQPYPNE